MSMMLFGGDEIEPLAKTQGILRWHACDLVTGRRLRILPLRGKPSDTIGDSVSVELTCDLSDNAITYSSYWAMTIPRRTLIVCERRFPGEERGQLIWGGIVISRPRVNGPVQRLSCMTIPGYFDRRRVGTNTWLESNGAHHYGTILENLIDEMNVDGIELEKDISGFSIPRGYRTRAPERRSFLAVLQELSDIEGGPEWTVTVSWSLDMSYVIKTFFARPRLGNPYVAGEPVTTFRYPGVVTGYEQTDDHTGTNGANEYTALRDGQGSSAPSRVAEDLIAMDVEGKWEADGQASGVTSEAEFQAAAAGGLASRLHGMQITTFTCDLINAPAVERDWTKGDDVLLKIRGTDEFGNVLSYGHPEGAEIIGRAIGWEMDDEANTMTPMIWTPGG